MNQTNEETTLRELLMSGDKKVRQPCKWVVVTGYNEFRKDHREEAKEILATPGAVTALCSTAGSPTNKWITQIYNRKDKVRAVISVMWEKYENRDEYIQRCKKLTEINRLNYIRKSTSATRVLMTGCRGKYQESYNTRDGHKFLNIRDKGIGEFIGLCPMDVFKNIVNNM
ncbi:MAG: hypothetical protein JKX76_01380 [Colwellia sp.]|nr:hypothetical protein [Colwellia sp.]